MLSKDDQLATNEDLTHSSLEDHWEVFSMKHSNCPPSLDYYDRFKSYLQRSLRDSSSSSSSTNNNKSSEKKRQSISDINTPAKSNKTDDESPNVNNLSRVSVSPQQVYAERKNVGQIVAHINSNLESAPAQATSGLGSDDDRLTVVDYKSFKTNVSVRYRFMFTTLEERSRALDNHLISMSTDMISRYATEMTSLTPLGHPTTDVCTVVGRVCNEAHAGRINKTALMLEGSRLESGGTRIHVNVEELKSYSLFPGQIVGVEGLCPSGRKMMAQKVCEGVPKPFASTSKDELLRFHHDSNRQDGKPLTIHCAAGPFTTTSNLEFEPLIDFLAIVRRLQPDVVVLVGPFVDSNHPMIQGGMCELTETDGGVSSVTFEILFNYKVVAAIEASFLAEPDMKTQFVIVPSLEDAFHENVFPQPPFQDRIKEGGEDISKKIDGADDIRNGTLGIQLIEEAGRGGNNGKQSQSQRVHLVSNPCTFKINEVVIGVTSTDPLAALNTQECSLDVNRMSRMAQHLIQQQSYFPCFPTPDTVNLDLRHIDRINFPVTPDILLVPSKLAVFAKDVVGSLVVNPGNLAKGGTGGTFSTITVHPFKREELEGGAEGGDGGGGGGGGVLMEHKVVDRTRVDILKI